MARHSDNAPADSNTLAALRVDKWLWAARFFKTRSLSSAAVKGGHVSVNGHRAKPSTTVRAQDRVQVSKGETSFELTVEGISEQRGPAPAAQLLYTESEQSLEKRRAQAEERRAARSSMPRPLLRPDKKQRRQLRRFKQGS